MKIGICLDDRDGISFQGKRQSRDRVLCADWVKLCETAPFWIQPSSAPLFTAWQEQARVSERWWEEAPQDAFVFAEGISPLPFLTGIETLIVYRWNRLYPSDCSLGFQPLEQGFVLHSVTDFVGSSHDRLTREIYHKEKRI